MEEKKFGRDLTTGSIPRRLLAYFIPVLAGNVIQTGYYIIDTMWIGKLIGDEAVAASAVVLPIVLILIAVASGSTLATTILVSQNYGAKKYDEVTRIVNTSFMLAILIGLFMTVAGIASTERLLHLMNTPAEIFKMAYDYLNISLLGFVPLYLGYLILSILRGIGDTSTPLFFLSVGIVLNILLDPFMIAGFGPFPRLELRGAAYATILSQSVAAVLAIIYLNRQDHIVAFRHKKLALDKDISLQIIKLGLPSIVQQSLTSIGSAFITSFVNTYGAAATAAFGAATRIDSVAFMPAIALGSSVSTLTGQNLGAGKPERVKQIFRWGVIMTSSITLLISLMVVSFPRYLLSIFVDSEEVLRIGTNYLRIQGGSYIFFAIMYIASGIANGAGDTAVTMLFSLVSLWIVRVPSAALLSRLTPLGLNGIWVAVVLSYFATMTVSLIYYFSGKWKKAGRKSGIILPDTLN